ncbi:hypothetical protein BC828DRAFT_372249 [Blastocladiella britannica]|nr:hypothetical protein BC828DRAFT_372249 [Blastocladiella britannica]
MAVPFPTKFEVTNASHKKHGSKSTSLMSSTGKTTFYLSRKDEKNTTSSKDASPSSSPIIILSLARPGEPRRKSDYTVELSKSSIFKVFHTASKDPTHRANMPDTSAISGGQVCLAFRTPMNAVLELEFASPRHTTAVYNYLTAISQGQDPLLSFSPEATLAEYVAATHSGTNTVHPSPTIQPPPRTLPLPPPPPLKRERSPDSHAPLDSIGATVPPKRLRGPGFAGVGLSAASATTGAAAVLPPPLSRPLAPRRTGLPTAFKPVVTLKLHPTPLPPPPLPSPPPPPVPRVVPRWVDTLSDADAFVSRRTRTRSPPGYTDPAGRADGLVNNGNTCYQNSVISVLLGLAPVASVLETAARMPEDALRECERRARERQQSSRVKTRRGAAAARWSSPAPETPGSGTPPSLELVQVLAHLADIRDRGTGEAVDPMLFNYCISERSDLFSHGRQEDAQELFVECLGFLAREPEGRAITNMFSFNLAKRVQCLSAAESRTANPTEPPCQHLSESREAGHNSLSLEIPDPQLSIGGGRGSPVPIHPLSELLAAHFAAEAIEYPCEACKHPRMAVTCRIDRSGPKVLVLHLKRFAINPTTFRPRKLGTPVGITEEVDLEPWVQHNAPIGDPARYRLAAVICHRGRDSSHGHYVSYLRDPATDHWWLYNDAIVSKVAGFRRLEEECRRTAYLLYYVRMD